MDDRQFFQQPRKSEDRERFLYMRSSVVGGVSAVRCKMGQMVKKGDVLVEFRNREIRLELQAAKIRLEKLATQRDRAQELFNDKVVTDKDYRKLEVALALAESDLALARIDVELWQHRLDRTQFRSPCDGRVNHIPVRGQGVLPHHLVVSVLPAKPSSEGEAEGSESK